MLLATGAVAAPAPDGVRLLDGSDSAGDAQAQGRSRLASGDVAGALAGFRRALVAAPDSLAALNGVAVCYDRLGQFDVSRSFYETARALAPGSALIAANFGYSLYLQGDHVAAATELAVAVAGTDAEAHAAAVRTLALIAATPRAVARARAERVAESAARIERSSDGEQRLVLGPAPRSAVAPMLADAAGAPPEIDVEIAAAVAVAAPWTARDDARLADAERLIARSEARVARSEAALPAAAPLRNSPPELPPVEPAAMVAALAPGRPNIPAPPVDRLDARRSDPAAADSAAAALHWLVALPASGQPRGALATVRAANRPREELLPFDSDDVVLNAFAARMRVRTPRIDAATDALDRLPALRQWLAAA